MANDCLIYQIDSILINGVEENVEQDSAVITNPTGWENELVPAAIGEHGVKRKRVASTVKYKLITSGDYSAEKYTNLDRVEITFRDSLGNRRGRISKATCLKHGELGKGDLPEIEWGCSSKIQWLS